MQGIGSIAIIIVLLVLIWWYNDKRHGEIVPDATVTMETHQGNQFDGTYHV